MLLQLVARLSAASTIDPQYAMNLTVFHVNQRNYSVPPVSMNSANLDGDMYFALRSKALPYECSHPNSSFMSGFDCANPETAATNLAITWLTLQVDRRFGTYAYCNVHEGDYTCLCQGYGPPTPGVDCTTKVGRGNCSEHGHHHHSWGNKSMTMTELDLWRENLGTKLGAVWPQTQPGAFWYSTDRSSQCKANDGKGAGGCAWRVLEAIKKVDKHCSDAVIDERVTRANPENAACFRACPQPTNMSQLCNIRCWMAGVLGKHGGSKLLNASCPKQGAGSRGSKWPCTAVGGMPKAELEAAWMAAFNSDDKAKGGCPDLLTPREKRRIEATPGALRAEDGAY